MIKKNICKGCNKKLKKGYNFCPNCGNQIKEMAKRYGMLGNTDKMENQMTPMFGMGNGMLNKMIGGAVKMLEKEISKEMNQMNSGPKVKLMINGKEINQSAPEKQIKDSSTKILPINFSKENLEKWKKLKKVEPDSKLQRIENKISYSLKVPGVKSIKDISIIKLENSIEVRAISDKTGYIKRIPINLPLKKYILLKEILTLELEE